MDPRDTPERDGDVTPGEPAGPPATLGGWLAQHATSLIIAAAVVAFVCIKLDPVTVALVALGLGLVIFIHELGHFVAAKWCDVHVETFSIGFGPPWPGCRFRRGETVYQIALVPLGGYVKMVGEGSEDEGEDDPRSFKNKTVGQRMLIISAGVIMNVLLAAACYVGVYMTTGADRPAGVIGTVDSGSPAWQKGLRPGAELVRMGSTENPYFDDVMPEVMHWKSGQPIPVTYRIYEDGKSRTVETDVTPRKNKERGRPMIGVGPAYSTALLPPNRRKVPPVFADSPAAQAEPPLRNGDHVVATTDPDQPDGEYRADRTRPLPDDPRAPGMGRFDYFELSRRLQRLAGRDVVLLVRHVHAPPDEAPEAMRVPPAFHTSFGFRLAMGPVIAVRDDSPAAKLGVQVRSGQQSGDTVTEVEVAEADGSKHRYVTDVPQPAGDKGVEPLDPARLPDQLRAWAARRGPGAKSVKVKLTRKAGHKEQGQDVVLDMPWDDSWRDEPSLPTSEGAPQAIDGLGLAYAIKTQVDDVRDNSPAAKAVRAKDGKPIQDTPFPLKKGDLIKSAKYFVKVDGELKGSDVELGWDQGAYGLLLAHDGTHPRRLGLLIQRGEDEPVEVLIDGEDDRSWPQTARGIRFDGDMRLEKADSLGEALLMGVHHTKRAISLTYQNLAAMLDGRISFPKNASGPITIAAASYNLAGENFTVFVLFIGMISVNLAVINFLPIPILDGGHMVFLLYEKMRGRPAPETVRVAATIVGCAMIVSLMAFVLFLDVKRLL